MIIRSFFHVGSNVETHRHRCGENVLTSSFSSFRVQDDLKLSDAETSYPLTGMVIRPKATINSMTKKVLLEGVCGILVKIIIAASKHGFLIWV